MSLTALRYSSVHDDIHRVPEKNTDRLGLLFGEVYTMSLVAAILSEPGVIRGSAITYAESVGGSQS